MKEYADRLPAGTTYEIIGDALVVLGDCREMIDCFDRSWAVVSDPPYGMKWNPDMFIQQPKPKIEQASLL